MKNILLLSLLAVFASVGLSACGEQTAGDKAENMMDNTADAMDDAADATGDAVEEGMDNAEEATDDATGSW